MKPLLPWFLALAWAIPVFADEPIMNMMPRWSGGWGFQFVHEYRHESDLLLGRTKKYPGFTEDVHLLHLQGVYTWGEIPFGSLGNINTRLTAKLPYVLDARREMPDGLGGKKNEKDHGIGDLTLALPLKKYDGSTSWTFKPMLAVPLVGDDEYEVYDNEWGYGLGLGYQTETPKFSFGMDTSGWLYHENEPFESHSSIDIGYRLYRYDPEVKQDEDKGAILWETDFHYEDDGSETLSAGPAFYWRFDKKNSEGVHMRLEWKHDFYDRQGVLDHGNGSTFKFGIGFVF